MKIFFVIILIFVTSCSMVTHHGIIINEQDVSAIKPKITHMEDVKTILGTPSFIWNKKWHYVSTTIKQKAFFTPKALQHHAYVISFKGKTVSQIEHFTEKDIISKEIKTKKIKFTKPNLKEVFE